MQDRLRLFFALWPDEAARRQLEALGAAMRKACGGRPTRPENLHLTLVFLGEVEAARLAEVKSAGDAVRVPPFELRFREPGYWFHNRIAWVAPADPPRALFDLVAGLQDALVVHGFPREERPYVPHLTLLRHARCTGGEWPRVDIAWPVREFTLVSSRLSEDGAAYERLLSWPLAGQ